MHCFVTGASGFIGAHVVRALMARGHRVRVLLRPGGEPANLAGLEVERVEATLADRGALRSALRGCDWCFHLAADYRLWAKDYASMYRTNVEGTREVLAAATEAGCARVVVTSTVGCIGRAVARNGEAPCADERTPLAHGQLCSHYQRSKWEAEQIALEAARRGRPVVIVNPTAPVGALDVRPTPTGQMIVDFLNRRMPAYLDTGMNFVDVRDVAAGHVLAAERGRIGERYILGHAEGNWTLERFLHELAVVSGLAAPRLRLPFAAALAVAHLAEGLAALTGRPPFAPLAGVRMARQRMFFSPAKAIQELGLPQTPVPHALAEAVEWFRHRGYVKGWEQVRIDEDR